MNDYQNEILENKSSDHGNLNELLIPTFIVFIASVAFYIYKANSSYDSMIHVRDSSNRTNITSENENSEFRLRNNSEGSQIHNNLNNISNRDSNDANTNVNGNINFNSFEGNYNSNHSNNSNIVISLNFVCNNITYKIDNISLELSLLEVFNQKLKSLVIDGINIDMNRSIFICMGKKVEVNKKLSEITFIKNSSTIHLIVNLSSINNNIGNPENSNDNNQDSGINNNDRNLNHNEVVYYSTLKIHFYLFLFFSFILYNIKYGDDMVSKKARMLIYLMFIIWVSQFTRTLTNLVMNKRVIWNK